MLVRSIRCVLPLTLLLTACTVEVRPMPERVAMPPLPPPPVDYVTEPAPAAVVSVYVEPPIDQPPPVVVGWAPPPMLVEEPPPPPFEEAVWIGGYWVWEGDWVWAHGRWAAPPRPHYHWVHPYYEHRADVVVFVTGHWDAEGAAFVPPPPGLRLVVEVAGAGVVPGPRPIGPPGCFVPAPPGSRRGIIVPAPIGTAPAVMTSVPAVIAPGMRVTNTTVVNNVTRNYNVTNITQVTVVAPPAATASGQAVSTSVPALAHLAAARSPLVHAYAPEPASARSIPAFVPGRPPLALPERQAVRAQLALRESPALATPQPLRPAERTPAAVAAHAPAEQSPRRDAAVKAAEQKMPDRKVVDRKVADRKVADRKAAVKKVADRKQDKDDPHR